MQKERKGVNVCMSVYLETEVNECRDLNVSSVVISTFSSFGIISCVRSQPARRQSSETTMSQSPTRSMSNSMCDTGCRCKLDFKQKKERSRPVLRRCTHHSRDIDLRDVRT